MKDHDYDDPEAIVQQLQQAEQDAEGFCEEIWKQKQRIAALEAENAKLRGDLELWNAVNQTGTFFTIRELKAEIEQLKTTICDHLAVCPDFQEENRKAIAEKARER